MGGLLLSSTGKMKGCTEGAILMTPDAADVAYVGLMDGANEGLPERVSEGIMLGVVGGTNPFLLSCDTESIAVEVEFSDSASSKRTVSLVVMPVAMSGIDDRLVSSLFATWLSFNWIQLSCTVG